MAPIIHPATGALLDALTRLDDSDQWLVEPRRLDDAGALWSPCVRTGVAAGSPFSLNGFVGPVLGIMHATTLAEAISLQNDTVSGLAAGLHSLDPEEVAQWLAGVEAGDFFVNRAATGAVVRRRPYGGWERSSVGPGAKTGGPNALLHLGDWIDEPNAESTDLELAALGTKVRELLDSATGGLDWRQFDFVRRGALSDEQAWGLRFEPTDADALGVERNVLRNRPFALTQPVVVRLSQDEPLEKLVRVLAAGTRARAAMEVSTALKLPRPLRALLKERRVRVFVESDAAWLGWVGAGAGAGAGAAGAGVGVAVGGSGVGVAVAVGGSGVGVGVGSGRIRMIGGDPRALAEALGGSLGVAVYSGDVTRAGRIELLPFLREQTVSVTNHRLGGPGALSAVLIR